MSLENTIHAIFRDTPKPPNSIELSFDGIENAKDLFECLLTFLVSGLRIKYGNHRGIVDMNKLCRSQFICIQKYFESFGIELNYDKLYINNENQLQYHLKDYRTFPKYQDLSSYIFTIYCKPNVYKFSFDFIYSLNNPLSLNRTYYNTDDTKENLNENYEVPISDDSDYESDDSDYESDIEYENVKVVVKENEIDKMVIIKYKKNKYKNNSCSFCLEDYKDNENL